MQFNSVDYAIFLVLVFTAYWLLSNHRRLQNALLLLVSYFFYGCWSWRFLGLIAFTTLVDYIVCLYLDRTDRRIARNFLLSISLVMNLGLLAVFKYYDFFVTSAEALLQSMGFRTDVRTLNLILPAGISFYTFQVLSYTIDVYRRRIPVCKDPVEFFAYVAFFPQLVAGPIERASELLPQFAAPRLFDYRQAVGGLRFILWGLFTKVVVADNCAPLVNIAFDKSDTLPSSSLVLGAVLFAFQIYGDFAGYSSIAIGSGALLGFQLTKNFATPYFSRDIAEFWRRWHMTLTSWFRDYVYFPLGGSRVSKVQACRNILIVFMLSGLWHGANWTFVAWGVLNAIYFFKLFLLDKHRHNVGIVAEDRYLPTLPELSAMLRTFFLTCIAWIFFRAATMADAIQYIRASCSYTLFSAPRFHGISSARVAYVVFFVGVMLAAEWIQRKQDCPLIGMQLGWPLRWCIYLMLVFAVLVLGPEEQSVFIYFQF